MIDLTNPEEIQHTLEEIGEELSKVVYFIVRDRAGFVAEEVVIGITFPHPETHELMTIEAHMRVNKEDFENQFMEQAKKRLLDDAKRISEDPESSDDDTPFRFELF